MAARAASARGWRRAAWRRASGVVRLDRGAEAGRVGRSPTAWSMGSAARAPAAAERDHRHAERAASMAATTPAVPREDVAMTGAAARWSRQRSTKSAGRRAPRPCGRSARRRRRRSRAVADPAAPSASSVAAPQVSAGASAPSATVTSQSRAVDGARRSGIDQAFGHFERVAGGGGQRLVHVGDQRPGAAARRRWPRRRGCGPARGRPRASP